MSIYPDKAKNSKPFWHNPIGQQLTQLHSSPQGLAQQEALLRLKRNGAIGLQPLPLKLWGTWV